MFLLDSVTVLGDDLGLESTFTRSRLDMDTLGDGLGLVLEIIPGMKGFEKPAHPGAVSTLLWKHFSISSLFVLSDPSPRPKYDDFDHLLVAVPNSVEVCISFDMVLDTPGLGSVLNSTPLVLDSVHVVLVVPRSQSSRFFTASQPVEFKSE